MLLRAFNPFGHLLHLSIGTFSWRGLILAFFLFAGTFKAALNLPFDLTVVFALLLFLSCVVELNKSRTLSRTVGLIFLLWIFLSYSIIGSDPEYGFDKSIRFYTLTLLAAIAPMILFQGKRDVMRFFSSLLLISIIVFVNALSNIGQLGQYDRLQAFDSNTIALGRSVGLGVVIVLVMWLSKYISGLFGFVLFIPMAFVMLASGSRGPLLATFIGLLPIFILSLKHSSGIRRLLSFILGVFLALAILIPFVPSQSFLRIQSFINGNLDTSTSVRSEAIQYTLPVLANHPLGIGMGQFANYITLSPTPEPLRYPHNIFLEIGLEGGWLPLSSFVILLALAIWRTLKTIRVDYLLGNLALGSLVFALINSSVSGDINDNKLLWAVLGLCLVVENISVNSSIKIGEKL